jgi:hypothetical protein
MMVDLEGVDLVDLRRRDRAHVRRARAVATLATDALRQVGGERLRAPIRLVVGGNLGIGVVAEEALVADAARHAFMVGAVVAGRHAPALRLRIPGEGQLIELAVGQAVDVRPGVMA